MSSGPFQDRVRDTLIDIRTLLKQVSLGSSPGATTIEDILTSIDLTLVNLETLLTNIDLVNTNTNWSSIPGNSIETTYDISDRVETMVYKTGLTTVFTKTFGYTGDLLTSITTS